MLMMMRADDSYEPSTEGCTAEELLACVTADDYDACIAACSDTEEPEEPTDPEAWVKQGKLTVSKANSNIETVPTGVPGVEMWSIKFSAGDEDVKLTSVTLKAKWYGNYTYLDNVFLQDKDGVRITKTRNVNAEWEVTLWFNWTYTLKANSTATFTIVNTIDALATNGITYGYEVTEVEWPESVKGLPVSTDLVTTTTIQNLWKVTVGGNTTYNTDVKVWEDSILWKMDVTLANNKEDVKLVSVKLKQTATNPASLEDSFDNLYLSINWESVTSKAVVNGKYVTFIFEDGWFVISKDRTSATKIDIMWTATAEPGKDIKLEIENAEDFVIKWETYGYNLDNWITTAGLTTCAAAGLTILSSEIATSFEKNVETDILATQANVSLWTLKMKASDTNFLLEKYVVEVTSSLAYTDADDFNSHIKNVKLWWLTADKVVVNATFNKATYTFEDINLPAWTQRLLELTFDVKWLTAAQTLTWDLDLDNAGVALHDEDNDKSYDNSNIANVVSSTAFANTVKVAAATLKTYKTAMPAATYVIDAWKEIIVAKWVLEAWNNSDVTVTDMVFKHTPWITDLKNNISSAKLVIDGKEYKWTVNATDIDINKEIIVKKGSANKLSYELVLTLKSAAAGWDIDLKLNTITAEDAEWTVVTPTWTPVTFSKVTLWTVWTLGVTYANTQSNKVSKSILWWTTWNVVAVYDIVANNEQINVKDLEVVFDTPIEARVNSVTLNYNWTDYTANVDSNTATFTDLNMVVDTTKAPLTISIDTIAFADNTDTFVKNVTLNDINVTKAYGVDSKTTMITWNGTLTASEKFDLVPATVVASVTETSNTSAKLNLVVNKWDNKAATNTEYNVYLADLIISDASAVNVNGLSSVKVENEAGDNVVTYNIKATCTGTEIDKWLINASEHLCIDIDTSKAASQYLLNEWENVFTYTFVPGSAQNPSYTIKLEKGDAIRYVVDGTTLATFATIAASTQLDNRQADVLTLVSR